MRLPKKLTQNNKATLEQYRCLTTIKLSHNSGFLITMRLPHSFEDSLQEVLNQYWYARRIHNDTNTWLKFILIQVWRLIRVKDSNRYLYQFGKFLSILPIPIHGKALLNQTDIIQIPIQCDLILTDTDTDTYLMIITNSNTDTVLNTDTDTNTSDT